MDPDARGSGALSLRLSLRPFFLSLPLLSADGVGFALPGQPPLSLSLLYKLFCSPKPSPFGSLRSLGTGCLEDFRALLRLMDHWDFVLRVADLACHLAE